MVLFFYEINNFNIYTIFNSQFRYSINNQIYMAKIYSKEKLATSKMLPKRETIQLILSYSAALKVIKVGKKKVEFLAN